MTPYAIILNGPSSAGKSTLARAIQRAAPEPVLHFTMDSFLEMIPEGVPFSGQAFPHMVAAIADCAAALLQHQHSLVIDVVFQPSAMDKLRRRLDVFNTLAVGVDAPLAVRVAREQNRADRNKGLTAAQEGTIHGDTRYDLVLDTASLTPDEAASCVLARVKNGPAPAP